MTHSPIEGYLTTAQAAERTGLTQRHVGHLCKTGQIQCLRVTDRLWLVERRSLDEYLTSKPKPGPKPRQQQKPK